MSRFSINVGGKELPCHPTMGALLLFKRNTGKDVSQMDPGDIEEPLMFMWCCICCACRAEGREFGVDFETFVCLVTPQNVARWNQTLAEQQEEEKKRNPRGLRRRRGTGRHRPALGHSDGVHGDEYGRLPPMRPI